MSVYFSQQRAVDPFTSYTSSVTNRLTRMMSEGSDCILKPGDLEVNSYAGIEWTLRAAAANNSWQGVCYGYGDDSTGVFVAVGTGAADRVMTSPDGINWTLRTAAANNDWRSVCYGDGLFVAVAASGVGNRVMTSTDGITWTSRTSAADNDWTSVCYGDGLFVAVAASGVGNRVMTSPDGINWTIRASASDNSWRSVCYGNDLYVAVASSGAADRVMTSPDGITWTLRTPAAVRTWRSVCYGNDLYVAVSELSDGNNVMTSPDGITWTLRTAAANNSWYSVCYGNNLFVAVSITGVADRVMTSPDGITWTSRTSAADNDWRSVCFCPDSAGMFVAVSQIADGNNVMTSHSETIVVVTTGISFKDDVYIEVTSNNYVDISDANYYISGSVFGDGVLYLCLEYVYEKTKPAPIARVRILTNLQHDLYPGTEYIFLKAITVSGLDITSLDDYDSGEPSNKRVYSPIWTEFENIEDRLDEIEEDMVVQSVHNVLTERDVDDCHPASSISNDSGVGGDTVKNALDNLNGSLSAVILSGLTFRPRFTWKDADEIYISSGLYHHNGTVNRLLYWNSQLTYQFGPGGSNPNSDDMTAAGWFYLYIDDSTLDSTSAEIDETNFISLTTSPTWSDSKHGWYNGFDRCIFAVKTDLLSEDISEFFNQDDFVLYSESMSDSGGWIDVDQAWTDIKINIPKFCIHASVKFGLSRVDDFSGMFWRTKGKIGAITEEVLFVISVDEVNIGMYDVITDENQYIQIVQSKASGNQSIVYTRGWYFPHGM